MSSLQCTLKESGTTAFQAPENSVISKLENLTGERLPPPQSQLSAEYCTQLGQGHAHLGEGLWFVFIPLAPAQPLAK